MKKLFIIVALILLAAQAEAGMVIGSGAAVLPNISIGNPSFESAIDSVANFGNWWPYGENSYTSERLASGVMVGSYVGHLYAQTGYVAGYCNGDGDTGYNGNDPVMCSDDNGTWTPEVITPSTAHLITKIHKADIDTSSGKITFDFRVTSSGTLNGIYFFEFTAFDSLGAALNPWDNGASAVVLAGSLSPGPDADNSRKITPSLDTTYIVSDYDLKSRIISKLNAGKTWSDVDSVKINFISYPHPTIGNDVAEMYIDNFR